MFRFIMIGKDPNASARDLPIEIFGPNLVFKTVRFGKESGFGASEHTKGHSNLH